MEVLSALMEAKLAKRQVRGAQGRILRIDRSGSRRRQNQHRRACPDFNTSDGSRATTLRSGEVAAGR
jgi:hypothetical protein